MNDGRRWADLVTWYKICNMTARKWGNEIIGVLGHLCVDIGLTGPHEDGEMNEITLSPLSRFKSVLLTVYIAVIVN